MDNNIIWHKPIITREKRNQLNQHKSVNLWFTGLSGSGKSTLAHTVEQTLFSMNCRTFVFDGDNVRHGLCSDLGFSDKDRSENIRRIAEMIKLFLDAGIISLTAFISPFKHDRERVKNLLGQENYIEVYCQCPLEVCEQRDVKGIYKKARNGEISNFTGISSPYEKPDSPDIILNTASLSLDHCGDYIINYLIDKNIISMKT